MDYLEAGTVAIAYAAGASLAVTVLMAIAEPPRRWRACVSTWILLILLVAIVSAARPGKNVAAQFLANVAERDLPLLAAVAGQLACGAIVGFAVLCCRSSKKWLVTLLGAHCVAAVLLSLPAVGPAAFRWISGAGKQAAKPAQHSAGNVKELFAFERNFLPTCIVVDPQGDILVAGYLGNIFENGVVMRLHDEGKGKGYSSRIVARSLNRPHGIAFYDGSLYVSRSGQFSRAVGGRIVQEDTGAVTQLTDLDGDGEFDLYQDVVSGLPGAQEPDGVHSNNGIAFDGKGFLYVTAGVASQEGPPHHKYEGTILRCRNDGTELTIFANGFRNPYGIAIGPDDAVFCTDNDVNADIKAEELNLVISGGHYGHPYTTDRKGLDVADSIAPIYRSSDSLQGLAYAKKGELPAGSDDCLYVAVFGANEVQQLKLKKSDDQVTVTSTTVASIPSVLDVYVDPHRKHLIACSCYGRKIYRIAFE